MSTSSATSYTVNAPAAGAVATSLTLTSSANPVVTGNPVTFTATVTPASGTTVPTGTVTFSSDGQLLGSSAVDGTGKATITTSTLTVGQHQIKATYNGNTNFAASDNTDDAWFRSRIQVATSRALKRHSASPEAFASGGMFAGEFWIGTR